MAGQRLVGCIPRPTPLSPCSEDVPVWGHWGTLSSPRLQHWVPGSRYQLRDAGEPGGLLGSAGLEPQLCCCHCEQVPAGLCASVSPLLEDFSSQKRQLSFVGVFQIC